MVLLVLCLISYLFLLKDVFSISNDISSLRLDEELPPYKSENEESLGDLFLGFLKYYATNFEWVLQLHCIVLCLIARIERGGKKKLKPISNIDINLCNITQHWFGSFVTAFQFQTLCYFYTHWDQVTNWNSETQGRHSWSMEVPLYWR